MQRPAWGVFSLSLLCLASSRLSVCPSGGGGLCAHVAEWRPFCCLHPRLHHRRPVAVCGRAPPQLSRLPLLLPLLLQSSAWGVELPREMGGNWLSARWCLEEPGRSRAPGLATPLFFSQCCARRTVHLAACPLSSMLLLHQKQATVAWTSRKRSPLCLQHPATCSICYMHAPCLPAKQALSLLFLPDPTVSAGLRHAPRVLLAAWGVPNAGQLPAKYGFVRQTSTRAQGSGSRRLAD